MERFLTLTPGSLRPTNPEEEEASIRTRSFRQRVSSRRLFSSWCSQLLIARLVPMSKRPSQFAGSPKKKAGQTASVERDSVWLNNEKLLNDGTKNGVFRVNAKFASGEVPSALTQHFRQDCLGWAEVSSNKTTAMVKVFSEKGARDALAFVREVMPTCPADLQVQVPSRRPASGVESSSLFPLLA